MPGLGKSGTSRTRRGDARRPASVTGASSPTAGPPPPRFCAGRFCGRAPGRGALDRRARGARRPAGAGAASAGSSTRSSASGAASASSSSASSSSATAVARGGPWSRSPWPPSRRCGRPPSAGAVPAGALAPGLGGPPRRDPLGQRLVLRLPLLEVADDRGGQEDRRVAPEARPTNSTSARSLIVPTPSRPAPTNSSPADRQQRDQRGVDRAHQRLVDGEVGRLRVRGAGAAEDAARVLVDLVEHDDGVVQRETEDGQQADDRRRA